MKKKSKPAVCRVCGAKHYSLTSNKDGMIFCVKCDKTLAKNK